LKEVFFETFKLAEEQIVGLLDEHNGYIGYCGCRAGGNELHVVVGIAMLPAQTAHGFQFYRAFFPLSLTMCLQIVFVIFQQFLQTGLCHIDELYLGNSSYASKLYVRHKVSFNANGGDYIEPAYVWSGETASETVPTKEGYDFAGWYTDADCTTAYDFSSAVTADITLYAKWEESPIIGDANGDGEVSTEDMVIIRQYLMGTLETEIADITILDVTANGIVDLKDLVRYKRYFAGLATLG